MAQNGKLRLELLDVYGKRLQEKVDIFLRNLHLSHAPVFRNKDASRIIQINDLHTGGQQNVYQISVDPPSYHPVSRFVTIKSSGTTELSMPFPVDIKKIVDVTFPTFPNLLKDLRAILTNSPSVLGFEDRKSTRLNSSHRT